MNARQTLILLPILLAAGVVLCVNIISIGNRLSIPNPLNPWESALIADAWRASRNIPVYTDPATGHATHMYGPLATYLLGAVFRMTGPNLYAGRVLTLAAATALALLLALRISPRRSVLLVIVGLALVLSQHYRARAYFTDPRPDVQSLLFGVIALLLFYRAHTRSSWRLYPLAIASLIIAFLFKQTAAAYAAIPLLAVLLTRPRRWWPDLAVAALPLSAVAITLLVLRIGFPWVYFYSIKAPSAYPIYTDKLLAGAVYLFTLTPLFLALLVAWMIDQWRAPGVDPTMRWIIAALAVTVPASLLAYAKHGGVWNSLLPVFLAMMAFCVAVMPHVLQRLLDPQLPVGGRLLASLLTGCLIVASALAIPPEYRSYGGPLYREVIEAARRLDGPVVCVDDPTIVLFATGQPGRSVDCELDASGRGDVPPWVRQEMRSARYVVRVHSEFAPAFSDRSMERLRFVRVKGHPFDGPHYSLWRNRRTALPQ